MAYVLLLDGNEWDGLGGCEATTGWLVLIPDE